MMHNCVCNIFSDYDKIKKSTLCSKTLLRAPNRAILVLYFTEKAISIRILVIEDTSVNYAKSEVLQVWNINMDS